RARQERERDVRQNLALRAVELVDPVHGEDVLSAHRRATIPSQSRRTFAPVKRLLVLGLLLVVVPSASATTPRILASLDWWPVSSPDGKNVAFTRVYASSMQLAVVNVKTKRVTKIGTSASQLTPTWSPSSAQLAYASGGVLYVVAANGTGKHRYAA